jgi:hypothetical protein
MFYRSSSLPPLRSTLVGKLFSTVSHVRGAKDELFLIVGCVVYSQPGLPEVRHA